MSITSISPVDGRYAAQTAELAPYFSEFGLIRYRVQVEIEWLLLMADRPEIRDVRAFTPEEQGLLRAWIESFDPAQAERVKEIERVTNHDVKAVEYYLKERLEATSMRDVQEFTHFCCTSEDINNLAYAQMLRDGIRNVWRPVAARLVEAVTELARVTSGRPMLARTHGQPATPTTLGKELAVFAHRWRRQLAHVDRTEYLGKFNGAVGTFAAHAVAYPGAPWEEISRALVEQLGLTYNPLTTQIESHDYMAELFHALARFHSILIDFDRDVWSYISLGYFRQGVVKDEVGSSAMPHKVNPIHFENSEANAGVSNALLAHLAATLPISRMQRDLTDSSLLRNVGSAIAHSVISLESVLRGIDRLQVNDAALDADLGGAWEVLAEAVQTVMRRAGYDNPYERLKDLTRGAGITRERLQEFVLDLNLPPDDERRLLELTPAGYTGLANRLARHAEDMAEFETDFVKRDRLTIS